MKPEDFSIRDLAEACARWPRVGAAARSAKCGRRERVGIERRRRCDGVSEHHGPGDLLEDHGGLQQEAFVVSKLVETIPTRLDGEKIPGISRVADTIDEVGPGMPYPHLGFGEDYIETPSTTKRGFIVPVTKEAIFFDRTHLVLSRAAEVGEVLGLNKEKRLIDLVIGVDQQLQVEGNDVQHVPDQHAVDQLAGHERAGRLDERR